MRSLLFIILFSSFLFASVGEITGFTGSVKVIRSNKPIDATLGMRVENRDLIKTSNNSKVQMVMDDNTVITLGKNSEFVIEEVDYASVNQKAKFSALKGAFKVMTGEISKTSPKGFELRGRTSTIGIRGTFFAGEVGELTDRVACIDGAIVVTSISTGDIVNVKAGEITSVNVGEPPAPPRNYTSSELDTLSGTKNESGSSGKQDKQDTNSQTKQDETNSDTNNNGSNEQTTQEEGAQSTGSSSATQSLPSATTQTSQTTTTVTVNDGVSLTAQQDSIEEQRKKNEQQIDPNQGTGSNPSAPPSIGGGYMGYFHNASPGSPAVSAVLPSIVKDVLQGKYPGKEISLEDRGDLSDGSGVGKSGWIQYKVTDPTKNQSNSEMHYIVYTVEPAADSHISRLEGVMSSYGSDRVFVGRVNAGEYDGATMVKKGQFKDDSTITITLRSDFSMDAALKLFRQTGDSYTATFSGNAQQGRTFFNLTNSNGAVEGAFYKNYSSKDVGVLGTIGIVDGNNIISGVYSSSLVANSLKQVSKGFRSDRYFPGVTSLEQIAAGIRNEIERQMGAHHPNMAFSYQDSQKLSTTEMGSNNIPTVEIGLLKYKVNGYTHNGRSHNNLDYHAYYAQPMDPDYRVSSFGSINFDPSQNTRTFAGSIFGAMYDKVTLERVDRINSNYSLVSITLNNVDKTYEAAFKIISETGQQRTSVVIRSDSDTFSPNSNSFLLSRNDNTISGTVYKDITPNGSREGIVGTFDLRNIGDNNAPVFRDVIVQGVYATDR